MRTSLGETLKRAYAAHQSGQLAEAERLYKMVLRSVPNQFDALHLLGVLEAQRGDNEKALRFLGRALSVDRLSEQALNNRANVLRALGRYDEALANCDRALKIKPDFAEAHNNRGNVLHDMRRHSEALESYDSALSIRPNYAIALANRANVLRDLRRFEEAAASCERALKLAPGLVDALNISGLLLGDLKRYDEAIARFGQALALQPNHPKVLANQIGLLADLGHYNEALARCHEALMLTQRSPEILNACGRLLRALNRYQEAVQHYDEALAVDRRDPQALCGRGDAMRGLKRYDEALESCERALAIEPNLLDGWHVRGLVLNDLGRLEEAVASLDKALSIQPDAAEILCSRGFIFQEQGRVSEALEDYEMAAMAKPHFAQAQLNRGICWLLLGDFERGFEQYEWRWKVPPPIPMPHSDKPLWRIGDEIAGRTILLHAEQGFGDTIHFCRYATLLEAGGARVLMEVQPALKSLLTNLDGVAQVFARGEVLPDFDLHLPLLSVPRVLGATLQDIPAEIPYLHADEAAISRWREEIGCKSGLKVGLVWAGNPDQRNDRARSIGLEPLQPLLGLPNIRWYGLQVGPRAEDLASLTPGLVTDLAPKFVDFAETAAAIANLDLVITVDTSIAHLSGALGRPCWVLLSHAPSWRWMLARTDSPWYPTLRLFRQPRPGDWASIVERVSVELRQLQGLADASS